MKLLNDYKKTCINRFEFNIIIIGEKSLSKSRNVGCIKCKYDRVMFMDSDCVFLPGIIRKYYEGFDKYQLLDGNVKFIGNSFQNKCVNTLREFRVPGKILCPTIGIDKKILDSIGGFYFDEDIKWLEDSELNIRLKKTNIPFGVIEGYACEHAPLTILRDLKSAYRYGSGKKMIVTKGLAPKGPNVNWRLIMLCFKKFFWGGIYSIVWNFVYCLGYFFSPGYNKLQNIKKASKT